MEHDWHKNGPFIIGGVGGSGTRLVAEICQSCGIFLGSDLNESLDFLPFTLLYRRYGWFSKNKDHPGKMIPGLKILEKVIKDQPSFSPREIHFILSASWDTIRNYGRDWEWIKDRLQRMFRGSEVGSSMKGWGWKEPNSHLLLGQYAEIFPDFKFIHTIRHGLDMAFSANQKQMKNWWELYFPKGDDDRTYSPQKSLKYWVKANQTISNTAKKLKPDQYLLLNFDRLCEDPEEIAPELIRFLGLELTDDQYKMVIDLPRSPSSIGRYKEHDLSGFDPGDLESVKQFGFNI